MSNPQEKHQTEQERSRQMREKQTTAKAFPEEQNNDNYTPNQKEEHRFHRMTSDELFRPESEQTIKKTESIFSRIEKPIAIHQWFVVLAIFFGVILVFLTPPFQVPDESAHFLKSYALSEFRLVPQVENGVATDVLDTKLTDFGSAFDYLFRHPEKKTSIDDIDNWNDVYTSIYNKKKPTTYPTVNSYIIYYLPQTFGMIIARIFGMSVLWTLFMGRLFNLFFYVAMLYFAIKRTPICKNLFFLLALLPMAIFQAASLSYDVMVISVCALFIAEVLNLAYNPAERFTTQSLVKFLILSIMLIFVKTVYFPLVILILAIPAEKFGLKKDRFRVFMQIVIATLAVYVIIMMFRRFIYAGVVSNNTMTIGQMRAIIMDPIRLLKVIKNTIQTFGGNYAEEFIGKFGWLDVFLPKWLISLYYIGLIVAIFEMNGTEIGFIQNHNFSDTLRLFGLTVIALTGFVLLMFAAFYYILTLITLKFENATIAYGIQGRYFIPVAYPLLATLATLINYKIYLGDRFYQITKMLNVVFVIVAQIVSIVAIATRYYF